MNTPMEPLEIVQTVVIIAAVWGLIKGQILALDKNIKQEMESIRILFGKEIENVKKVGESDKIEVDRRILELVSRDVDVKRHCDHIDLCEEKRKIEQRRESEDIRFGLLQTSLIDLNAKVDRLIQTRLES